MTRLRIAAMIERARASLFLVPMIGVVLASLIAQGVLVLDDHLGDSAKRLPLVLTSTVENARAVLSTVAAATMAFAGIAFSVSLLVIQLGSAQYSPRVVHTLFHDRFNRRVMALVVGTFAYCVLVLRAVRSSIDSNGHRIVPNVGVSLAVLLGIITILAIVAFINHNAHVMDVSTILHRIQHDSQNHIESEWPTDTVVTVPPALLPSARTVRFEDSGWVQQIDYRAMLESLDPGTTFFLDTYPGRFAIAGTVLGFVQPSSVDLDEVASRVRNRVGLGETRTLQGDFAYGLRQLADIALRALSPGVNDPTTAQDAIFHAGAVLLRMLERPPLPTMRFGGDDCRLVFRQAPSHDDLVVLCFGEVRAAAASAPAVCLYLLETMSLLRETILSSGLDHGLAALEAEARRVVQGCESSDSLPADIERVRDLYARRFGNSVGGVVR